MPSQHNTTRLNDHAKPRKERTSTQLLYRRRVTVKAFERHGIRRGDTAIITMDGDVRVGDLGYLAIAHIRPDGYSPGRASTNMFAFICEQDHTCKDGFYNNGKREPDSPCLRRIATCEGLHNATPYGRVISIQRNGRTIQTSVPFRPIDERESLMLREQNRARPNALKSERRPTLFSTPTPPTSLADWKAEHHIEDFPHGITPRPPCFSATIYQFALHGKVAPFRIGDLVIAKPEYRGSTEKPQKVAVVEFDGEEWTIGIGDDKEPIHPAYLYMLTVPRPSTILPFGMIELDHSNGISYYDDSRIKPNPNARDFIGKNFFRDIDWKADLTTCERRCNEARSGIKNGDDLASDYFDHKFRSGLATIELRFTTVLTAWVVVVENINKERGL